jgi:hypothetical protein
MALTVRLTVRDERALSAVAKRKRLSRSQVVREALAQYAATDQNADAGRSPFDAWADVIGIVRLGIRNPAATTGEQFTDMLRDGARARRSR